MHASNAYRRRVLTVLAAREVAAAYTRAAGQGSAGATTGVRLSPGVAPTRPGPVLPPSATLTPAHGRATTHLTVNGAPVTLSLLPRVTLADALRDHLGLTGTHLGCEYGNCGMCTVLVNGQAPTSPAPIRMASPRPSTALRILNRFNVDQVKDTSNGDLPR
jgi:hypothetical protein